MTMAYKLDEAVERLAESARRLGFDLVRDPRDLESRYFGLRSTDGTWMEFDVAGCTGEESPGPSYGTLDAVTAWLNDQQVKYASMTRALKVAAQLLARACQVLNSCAVPNYHACRDHAAARTRLEGAHRYIERKAVRHGVAAALQDTTEPALVLGALRECLLEYMSNDEWLEHCRVDGARYLGASGRILAENEVSDGDPPVALAVTMANGNELRLDLIEVVRG